MNRSKQKGTAAETAVKRLAEDLDIPVRRMALAGQQDEGDVHLWNGEAVIEVKTGDQTVKPSWNQIHAWYQQAVTEAGHSGGGLPLLVLKRAGSGQAKDWYLYWSRAELAAWSGLPVITGEEDVLVSMRLEDGFKVLKSIELRKNSNG